MNASIPTRLRSRFEWWHYVALFFLALQVGSRIGPAQRQGDAAFWMMEGGGLRTGI